MKTTTLLIVLVFTCSFSHAQKKKVVYLDTLGNEVSIYDHLAILNTAWYEWAYDESDPNTRYVGFKKLSKREHDSLTHLTYQKNLLLSKTDRPFVLPSVTDLSGKTWTQEELDKKIVVVNFWFVGCGPCEIEMAELNQLVAKYQNNPDVVFLSLCNSKGKKIERFLERKPFDFHIASAVDQTIPKFGISTFPTNFVVDHGAVRLALEGTGNAIKLSFLFEVLESNSTFDLTEISTIQVLCSALYIVLSAYFGEGVFVGRYVD